MITKAWLRRNVFEQLYMLKSGSSKIRYWKALEKTQYYSAQALADIQWERLKKIWAHLWRHNPYYRERFIDYGLTEKSLRSPDDIRQLPIITKKEIRNDTHLMFSDGYTKQALQHFKTGGSTGKALDIFITEECSELRNACARRHDRWTGWEPGEPVGAAWGNPKLPKSIKTKLINDLVQPYIFLDTMAVTEDSVKLFAAEWEKARPTLLFGHAHSIFILAGMVKALGLRQIKPAGIIATSMMLLQHERSLIEQVFGVPVTDRYGCEEVSLIGCECERHIGMHMNIEHLVIEFVKEDGTYAAPGETGNIVVTDLMNLAMPFIRYKVEDIGVPLSESCPCGRGLPLMGKVAGRVADFLVKQDGTRIAGISIIENTLTKWTGIDQMQIIQEQLTELVVKVVPGKGYSDSIKGKLIDYFKQLFGMEFQIRVEEIDEIEPEKSGKFRFSICKIHLNNS